MAIHRTSLVETRLAREKLGAAAIVFIIWIAVRDFDVIMIGVSSGHPAATALPAICLATAIASMFWPRSSTPRGPGSTGRSGPARTASPAKP